MQNKLLAQTSVSIKASPKKVWHALTTPATIKQYLMGAKVTTTWEEGSPIIYTGEYRGIKYRDKGIIKKFEPNHVLQSTYLSSMWGKEDKPENYNLVTYTLKHVDNRTILTLTQDNNASAKDRDHATQNWKAVLKKLKTIVESEVKEKELA